MSHLITLATLAFASMSMPAPRMIRGEAQPFRRRSQRQRRRLARR